MNPAATAAELLSQRKIQVGFRAHGIWSRALGSRSILADARDPEMNAKVTTGEIPRWWRPFAIAKERSGG